MVEARRSKEGLLRVRTRRGGWASTHSKLGQELLTRTEASRAFLSRKRSMVTEIYL
eukprot:COSAG01_NODE_2670_length_7274_cov_4.395540_9_plen_56_part_00